MEKWEYTIERNSLWSYLFPKIFLLVERMDKEMIYLDNAATTMQKPQEVIEAVVAAMGSMGNAGRGVNDASLSASRIIYDTRERICRLVGGSDPRQVAFTCNSTESLNIAIRGLLKPGDHVITTMLEHNSVLRPLYDLETNGTSLTIVKSDANGNFDIEDMKAAVRPDTKMIVCTNGSNLTGNYVDPKPIGEFARERGILFVVDASQTAGVFPIDVKDMKIDVLCFTGHKGLLGPQGTGGLYVREGVAVRSMKVGGTGVQTYSKMQPVQMPTVLEAGTLNGHGIAGLHAALGYIEKYGMDKIRMREQELMWRFYEGVKDIEHVRVYGDFSTKNRCAIVTLNIGDYDSSEGSDELLTEYGISTRSGGHCAPLMHKALGTVEQGAVRFSFSHYNTDEEVDAAIRAVQELARDEES